MRPLLLMLSAIGLGASASAKEPSPEEITAARERVTRFIAEHEQWALKHRGPPRDEDQARRDLKDLFGRHATRNSKLGDVLVFSDPPEHTTNEKIEWARPELEGSILVGTRAADFGLIPTYFEYDLKKVGREWRIHSIAQYVKAETLSAGASELPPVEEREPDHELYLDLPAYLRGVFTKGQKAGEDRDGSISLVKVGRIHLASGRVAVADHGYTYDRFFALARTVAPGTYDVVAAVAQFKNDQRVAGLKIVFRRGVPTASHRLASVARVDSGTLAVFDPATYGRLTPRERERLYDRNVDGLKDFLVLKTTHAEGTDLIWSRAGWGDGAYPVYWALGSDGQPTELIVDFRVVGYTRENVGRIPISHEMNPGPLEDPFVLAQKLQLETRVDGADLVVTLRGTATRAQLGILDPKTLQTLPLGYSREYQGGTMTLRFDKAFLGRSALLLELRTPGKYGLP